jgi:hypothetical protein
MDKAQGDFEREDWPAFLVPIMPFPWPRTSESRGEPQYSQASSYDSGASKPGRGQTHLVDTLKACLSLSVHSHLPSCRKHWWEGGRLWGLYILQLTFSSWFCCLSPSCVLMCVNLHLDGEHAPFAKVHFSKWQIPEWQCISYNQLGGNYHCKVPISPALGQKPTCNIYESYLTGFSGWWKGLNPLQQNI